MKDQINRYARGVFAYEPPVLLSRDNSISAVVDKNQSFCGTLALYSSDGREIRGYVCCNNDKISIEHPGFEGKELNVSYYVHSQDCVGGETIEGNFYVVSNGGELTIPFSFQVETGSHESSIGPIRNLTQFTNLVKSNPDEAARIFMAADFSKVYLERDPSAVCLYEGIITGQDVRNNMEEFLIGIGRKSQVHLSLSENRRSYEKVEENFKDTVALMRDTWGYTNVKVSTEAAFIRLERKLIDADSFSGNRYDFSYVVDCTKLHAGRNTAYIVFESDFEKITLQLQITRADELAETEDMETRITGKKLTLNLMILYIRFRTHAIPVEEWIRESRIVLEALLAMDGDNVFYKLALAQLFITEKKDPEAKALMDEVKDDIHAETEKELPLYCYFIYVNTLYNKEYAYSKRASIMIRECFEKNDDWRILWTLLFIDEEMENNSSLKLLRIKEQFNKGCHSPVLYLEACRILNEEPHLLRVVNAFEAAVLYFGARNHMIEEKLSEQAASMIISIRYGTEKYIRLMWALYRNHPTRELLECMCKILVRNSIASPAYLEIYGEAIRMGLKITQLFEYYVMSRSPEDMSPLPKMVLMYFGYNNSLDYRKKAYLYANIIYNKKDNPQSYLSYQLQMKEFIRDQLLLGHVNEHLCMIYEDILTPDMVDEENAAAISEIFNTYRIEIAQEHITQVVVRHKETDSEKEYPVTGKEVLVRMYTQDACVFLVKQNGKRYLAGNRIAPKRLIENEKILKRCYEVCPKLLYLALYYSEKNKRFDQHSLEAAETEKALLAETELTNIYKRFMISDIIDYYYESYDAQAFTEFMETVSTEDLEKKDYIRVVEIYIVQGDYEHAYRMLANHSAAAVMPKRLLKLCSRKVINNREEDARLVALCYTAFAANRYDETTLQYLSDYYVGPSEDMIAIWKHAMEVDADTYRLEERIITQMLFAGSRNDTLFEIFDHYYSRGPKERVVEAYLAYFSYAYFVKNEKIPDNIFELIEVSVENERDLAMICAMALVRYYAGHAELTAFQREIATQLVDELTRKDYVFPFFLRLQDSIRLPMEISDRTMVEYRANPKSRVIIHYMVETKDRRKEYIAEDMKQTYDGIFVKQFILFYDESLTYYITEENQGATKTSEKVHLTGHSIRPDKTDGRYDAINDLIAGAREHDSQTVEILLRQYAVRNQVADELFVPLYDSGNGENN